MALTRHLTALSLALVLGTSLARAQSVAFPGAGTSYVDRKLKYHTENKQWWVSHRDCVEDDVFTFDVDLVQFSSYSLEVWAGASCTDKLQRQGDQATCWQVYKAFPQTKAVAVKVLARDVVAKVKPGGQGSGQESDCNRTDIASSGEKVTLFFMLIDSNNEVAGTYVSFDMGFDVVGPAAPTNVSAGVGENLLVVSWDAPSDEDRNGYNVYCDTSSGPGSSPAAGGAAGAATDAGTDAASDAATEASAGGSGGADGGGTDGGGTDGGGTGGGSAGNANCPSAALTPGTIPTDNELLCGSTGSKVATEANADGLQNGVTYAVAVATKDELGNVGPLSKVACGTPQIVDDFFELYRRAGGKGGGGFCSIHADPSGATLALAGLALGAWWARRRRRQG